ncbi:MAG: hypothetical protein AAF718_11265 [Pseudomonadota bacterium]
MSAEETNRLIDDLAADYDGTLKDDLTDEERQKLAYDLADITSGAEAEGMGDADAVFGGIFVDATSTAWAMLQAIVALGLAIAPDPTGLSKLAVAKIVWDFIKNSNGAVRRLNEDEQMVVTAIAKTGGEHWRSDSDHAVPLAEIAAHLKGKGYADIQGLEDVLAGLAQKGVIQIITSLEHGNTYKVAL